LIFFLPRFIQLLNEKENELTTNCQMNILFILNKSIADLAPPAATEVWLTIVEKVNRYLF
jgi:hypothetical protein